MIHRSVLLNEIVSNLRLRTGSLVVDGTLGAGGHSMEICRKFPETRIIGIDQDARAIREAVDSFEDLECEKEFVLGNFKDIKKVLGAREADAIILDLGFSSDQIESSGRGFSFTGDEPLLMTMKENPSPDDLTASTIVNEWSEDSLEKIFLGYGEERRARKIAKAIGEARKKKKIETTSELVKVIEGALGRKGKVSAKINPATKTFQALRIAVNDELGSLDKGMRDGFEGLRVGGRMFIISFHSLEDRVVKKYFKELAKGGKGILISKKPITASRAEEAQNKRSRSAKLRIIEKIK